MNIEKLETLLKKVESAATVITKLKENEVLYKGKMEQLIGKIEFLSKENADLKDQNKALIEKINNSEAIHSNIEQRIINILEKLPDFDIESNAGQNHNLNTQEETFSAVEDNNDYEENTEHLFSENHVENIQEIKENNHQLNHDNYTETAEIKAETNLYAENTSSHTDNNDSPLPQFEDSDDNDEVFSNMFAFDEIIDNDSENTFFEEDNHELPKGVM